MSLQKEYQHTYTSFSGADITASISLPTISTPIVIGELQTISYSIHREVTPVRTLGRINPVGFTNGQRTIAGSLIFTVFDRHVVYDILEKVKENNNMGLSKFDFDKQSVLMDEMPPFDITISMVNEYGQQSRLAILGIVIVDEGQVMSIEDMITENTMSYLARDIRVLDKTSNSLIDKRPGVSLK